MKSKNRLFLALGGTALVLSLASGCSSTNKNPDAPLEMQVEETKVVEQGVPGGVATRTTKLRATVTDINYETRSITLEDSDGNSKTVEVGPEAQKFDQIAKGDTVAIEYIEEQVIYLNDADKHEEDKAALVASNEKEDGSPGAMAIEVIELVATVTAVDLENHSVTLTFSNGKTVEQNVRPDVEILESHVGRQVVIRHTNAFALEIEKQ
jgi:hypothetical protein